MHNHEAACRLVVARLDEVLRDVIVPGPLSATVDDILHGVAETFALNRPNDVLSVHLPLAFVDDLETGATDLVGVAAACSALHVGARLLDDLMDGHDISYFSSEQSAMDVLGWATFLSVIPPLVLSRLDAPPEIRVLVVDDMSAGMATMASGQLGDVNSAGPIPTPKEAMAAIRGKTGALAGTFARCAGRVAGLTPEGVEAATRYGYALGVGRQLMADRNKLDETDRRTDRLSPTYLVAVYADSLEGDERASFEQLVTEARTEVAARAEVAKLVLASEAPAQGGFTARFQLAHAEAVLPSTQVGELAAARLGALVAAAS